MAVISLDFSAVLTCPNVRVFCVAQQMHGSLAPRPVVGPSGRLAVNGDHLTGQQFGDGLGPRHEAVLELGWVQRPSPGVMGGDAVGQFQEGLKPFQLAPAEEFHMDPGIEMAAQMAMARISTSWWRRVRSTRGSSKSSKWSKIDT